MTTIDEEGFLSSDIVYWIAKHRAANSGWLELAERLNRIGCRLQSRFAVPSDDNQLFLIAVLFMRALATFQTSVLLTERGATTDARTLISELL